MDTVPYAINRDNETVRRKINKILENQHDGERDTIEALQTLSSFYYTDASRMQINFRNEIENKDLQISKGFLKAFKEVKLALDSVYNSAFQMSTNVENMAARLQDSKNKTRHLIEQTTILQEQKSTVTRKIKVADAMISHFQLKPDEHATLHGTTKDSPITPDFFVILERIECLYEDCKILSQSKCETLALDLMEKISMHKEAAIERLYRWAQHSCRNADLLNSETLIPKALCKLQSRSVLFKYVLEEYCCARKSTLVRAFIDALTKGSSSGAKPIEFYANDAKRYIGDILAWIHQIIPIEKDSLLCILKECQQVSIDQEVNTSLIIITEGICQPMKVRAELIITPDKKSSVLCAILSLLQYYKNIISQNINSGLLIDTLDDLIFHCEDKFFMSLDRKVQTELSLGVKAPPTDLTPSLVVTDLLKFMREIMAAVTIADNVQNVHLKKIIVSIIDPLLMAINETACHLSSTDMAVYLLNCIYQIQCTLSLYQNMDDRNERLQAQSDAQIDSLTSEQASSLVANLNLGPIYTILQEQNTGPLSAIPAMEAGMLKSFMNKFDHFVAMPDAFLLPQIDLLLSSSHRSTVKKRSFDVIIAIYRQLYDAVHIPLNNYIKPESVVRRSPEEISQLLLV